MKTKDILEAVKTVEKELGVRLEWNRSAGGAKTQYYTGYSTSNFPIIELILFFDDFRGWIIGGQGTSFNSAKLNEKLFGEN